jgi:hypothetical protein
VASAEAVDEHRTALDTMVADPRVARGLGKRAAYTSDFAQRMLAPEVPR